MNLLIDANLSPTVATRLIDAGQKASHVSAEGLLTATDEAILAHAAMTGQVIVSADSDFATLLAFARTSRPSVVLLRSADRLTPSEQAEMLLANLPTVDEDLREGAVVSISRGHLRVRRLPLTPSGRR